MAGRTRVRGFLPGYSALDGRFSVPEPHLVRVYEFLSDPSKPDAVSTADLIHARSRLVREVCRRHLDGQLAPRQFDHDPSQSRLRARVEVRGTRAQHLGVGRMDGLPAVHRYYADVHRPIRRNPLVPIFSALRQRAIATVYNE